MPLLSLKHYRLFRVIYEIMEDVLRNLFDCYLKRNHTTFEKFLNDNQHDIYHFFMNKEPCCVCQGRKRHFQVERVLQESQFKTVFDVSSTRKTNHLPKNSGKFCCCFAIKNVQTDVLDFTLLRFFLVNFCEDLIWHRCEEETGKDFPEILLQYRHDIYHLFNDRVSCCQCRSGYEKPKAFRKADPKDLRKLFLPHNNKKCQKFCSCCYEKDTTLTCESLRKNIGRQMFIYLTSYICNMRNLIEQATNLRNDIVHNCTTMSDERMTLVWEELEACGTQLAKVAQCEETTREKFNEIKSCTFDQEHCEQMMVESRNDIAEDMVETCLQQQNHFVNHLMKERHKNKRKRIGELDEPFIPRQNVHDIKNQFVFHVIQDLKDKCGISGDTQAMEVAVTVEVQKPVSERPDQPMEEQFDLPHVEPLDRSVAPIDSDSESSSESESDKPDIHKCGKCGMEFTVLDEYLKHAYSGQKCKKRLKRKEKTNTDLTNSLPTTETVQVRMEFTNVDDNWYQTADEIIRQNPQQLDTEDITIEYSEMGSLVVWAKMKSDVMEKEEKLQDAVKHFVSNMLDKCPIIHQRKTTLQVKFDVVSGIEDDEEDEEDGHDTFKCGRCDQVFYQVEFFCSHKLECKRKRKKRRVKKEFDCLPDAQENTHILENTTIHSPSTLEETMKDFDNTDNVENTEPERQDYTQTRSKLDHREVDRPQESVEKSQIYEDNQLSSQSTLQETIKNDDVKNAVDGCQEDTRTRSTLEYSELVQFDQNLQDSKDVNATDVETFNIPPNTRLPIYKDEIEQYEIKFSSPVQDISRGARHKVRKKKKKQKPIPIDEWLHETGYLGYDSIDEICEKVNKFYDASSESIDEEENYFKQSCKTTARGIAEDSMFMKNGLDLDHEFVSDIVSTFRRKETKCSFYDSFIENIDELEKLLKSDTKKYKRGFIEIEASHSAKCKITNECTVIDISGRSKCGKAFSDDEVVVEILGTEETSKCRIQMLKREHTGRSFGKVIGVVKKNRCAEILYPVFICEIDEYEFDKAKPLCKTVPKFHLLKKPGEKDQFSVTIYKYSRGKRILEDAKTMKINIHSIRSYLFYVVCLAWDDQYPLGAIVKVHQSTLNFVNCMDILKLQFKVPFLYSPQTTCEVDTIVKKFDVHMFKGRRDLRAENVFSIDPEGSKVFDDAISINEMPDGITVVGIHIADVASIIPMGSDLDNEAFLRVTTFFPGQFLNPHHLLPEPLSQNICSLNKGEEKLAISTFLSFDKENNFLFKRTEFCKSVIRSKHILSYKEAQEIINDSVTDHPLKKEIGKLNDISKALRRKMLGAARFSVPVEVNLPGERDENCSEAYALVEQFMVLTNHVVAIFLLKTFPDCVPLRCHDATSDILINEWIENYPQMSHLILHLQGSRSLQGGYIDLRNIESQLRPNDVVSLQRWVWQELINEIGKGNIKAATELVCSDELHPFQALALADWEGIQLNAEYRCSGKEGQGLKGQHTSLRLIPYVHFTAPIRRYIDIVVQRLLHQALNKEKDKQSPYQKHEISAICSHVTSISKTAGKYRSKCKEIILGDIISKTPLLVNSIVQDFTESEIIFIIPGIKFLHQKNKTLPLRYLLMCLPPTTSNDMDQLRSRKEKSKLILYWKKRIYSARTKLPHPQNKQNGYQKPSLGEYQQINPKQKAVYLRTSVWINTIKVLTSGATNSQIKAELMHGNVRRYLHSTFNTEFDINSEIYKPDTDDSEEKHYMFPEQFCMFSHTFNHGQVLRIQISAEMKNGLLTTNVDFLDLTQNIKFCMKHMRDTISSFGIVTDRCVQDQYQDSQEYKDTWIPIMQMETIFAVIRESGIVINDVFVKFDSDGGNFTFKTSFLFERNISFSVLTPRFLALDKNPLPESELLSGTADYLCIRTCINFDKSKSILAKSIDEGKYFWIGHAKICRTALTNKGTSDEKLRVWYKLSDGSIVPECLRQCNGCYCTIEILQRAEAEKRTEVCIENLNKADRLAKAIALNKDLPEDCINKATTIKCDIDIGLPANNSRQSEAIRKALKNRLSLIHGPPGTGKTYTCIKLIHLFHQMNKHRLMETEDEKDKILVCGPSNKSVDLIARRLRRYRKDGGPSIIRFYGTSIEQSTFGIPGKNVMEQRGSDYKPDPDMNDISVHHLVRKRGDYLEEIRKFEEKFRRDPYRIDSKTMSDYRDLLKSATIAEIRRHDVILCTTSMATSPRLLEAVGKKISQLVIDESGMCTEPESIATIIAARPNQVTLIGDHMQLRPIVMSKHAADLGLQRSLFERYSRHLGKSKFIQLYRQYRMHKSICHFPSTEFYNGSLKTEPSASYEENPRLSIWLNDRGLHREERHVFCHIEGVEEVSEVSTEDQNEHSFKNDKEVEQVMKILRYLHRVDKLFTREKKDRDRPSLNVMSQYNAQCNALQEAIQKDKMDSFVDVHTVVSSQGGEWDYVIFSMVRSLPDYRIEPRPTLGWCKENLGFISDQNQINVALTRAKKGLFLIGNEKLLKCDPVFKKLLGYYREKNCIIDCTTEDFPRHKRKK